MCNIPDPVISSYAQAPTKTVRAGGTTFAYRDLGPAKGIPVVLFNHLGANLDNVDPRIVDALAATRRVIAFDQPGVGASSGQVPATIEAAADDAFTFVSALGLGAIDVFAFSMGGFIVQDLAIAHPDLVRRQVLAGTGPRGGRDIEKVVRTTYLDVLHATLTRRDPKELLFFNRDATGRKAGKEFIARLHERTADRDAAVTLTAFRTQLKAIARYGRSAPSDLSAITAPTLVANGDNDRMVPSALSEDLHRRIDGSRLVIYPDSGHGAVFQYWEDFAPRAAAFLAA